jgi:hypothetical protein
MPGWRVMESAAAPRTWGIWFSAVFTVVVSLSIASSPAQAACSDYVRHGSPPLREEISLGGQGGAQSPTGSVESLSSSPLRERRGPCTGALCSRKPVPASTATLIDMQRVGNWAILSVQTRIAVPEAAPCPKDEQIFLPLSNGPSIDHPPRLP